MSSSPLSLARLPRNWRWRSIAKEFAQEHLPGYEAVIAVHVDKGHIHAHIIFNSVNADTGEKCHSNARSYYSQIRVTSDWLCRKHGLSIVMEGQPSQAVSYVEWLRQSKGQPTFRSMLEANLRTAIEGANDLGHFFLLMEHQGYEIYHGNRLGFRLRGQNRFVYPGRKNPLFAEEGIRAAIQGNLEAIEAGLRPPTVRRPVYRPYKKHPKYTSLLALYDTLADVDALALAKQCYEDGLSGMEAEFTRYMDAVAALERCNISKEQLVAEKADIYQQMAEVNRQIRAEKKKLALRREICSRLPQMEQEIQKIDTKENVMTTDYLSVER